MMDVGKGKNCRSKVERWIFKQISPQSGNFEALYTPWLQETVFLTNVEKGQATAGNKNTSNHIFMSGCISSKNYLLTNTKRRGCKRESQD